MAGSRSDLVHPDLRVLLIRPTCPAGHGEIQMPTVGVEDRCPGTLDGRDRRECRITVGGELPDDRDGAFDARGLAPAPTRVEIDVIAITGNRHAVDDPAGVAVHD